MHELAIMDSALNLALDQAEKAGANRVNLIRLRIGALSGVVTLASLYPASTVLLARFLLGERLNRVQIVGIACALVAVMLIVTT